ncbi:hypothetical protein QM261_18185, partial [Acinetobacter baumannii]|nr:hypothetical protein [Acinetobacter baumannii]
NQDVDWRWMHDREDSPWYPGTVRLFRRGRGDSWIQMAERLRAAFAAHFTEQFVKPDAPLPASVSARRMPMACVGGNVGGDGLR